MIRIENLTKNYGVGRTEIRALDGIDFNLKQGEFIAIQGPSGCGKSTLLNMIGCLEKPTHGKILIDGIDISILEDKDLARIRREKIGFIFQRYNLISTLNAIENVMFPMLFAGKEDKKANERAAMLLEMLGMKERRRHKPSELSGGEQQRVAIARALSNEPLLIIGDEPTGNLDSQAGCAVMQILTDLNKQGQTVVVVTHDPSVAAITHRVMRMKDGRFIDSQSNQGDKNEQNK
jgi:putative ABC transport system ATP-binding protein